MNPTGKCRSCDAPIVWCRTEQDRWIPLDPDPDESGNIVALGRTRVGETVVPRVRIIGHPSLFDDHPDADTRYRYMAHFTSCPNADSHRRR